jgi:hypothetical protein
MTLTLKSTSATSSHVEARLGPHLLHEEQRGDPQLLAPERRALEVHEAPPQPHAPPEKPAQFLLTDPKHKNKQQGTHHTAFIMRRLMVKYSPPTRITGNWSCTVPPLG